MLILTKCVLEEQQSHDGLTRPQICCLRAILDGFQVNWARTSRLVEEYKRFEKIQVSEEIFLEDQFVSYLKKRVNLVPLVDEPEKEHSEVEKEKDVV